MDEMDFENKLQFICDADAAKPDIREAIETQFDVVVDSVNTQVTMDGEKKATVRFEDPDAAEDIMSRVGVF